MLLDFSMPFVYNLIRQLEFDEQMKTAALIWVAALFQQIKSRKTFQVPL